MRQFLRRARVVPVALLVFLLLATPAGADLRTESEITYTADVEGGSLALESRLHLTNLTPDVRDGDQITRFFYDEIRITVPETVQNFRASSGGQTLSHTMRPGDEQDGQSFLVATIDLGRRLLYQESMELVVEYEIPGDPPRSVTTFRINPAYINFAVVAWGDPGLTTVNVVTPARFDLELTGAEWDSTTTTGDLTVHTITGIEDPAEFLIRVKGYDDSALVIEQLDVGGIEIVMRAWPSDDEWTDLVAGAVTTGLPVLMDLIGLPWGLDEPLPVNQSAEVSLAGYGGWYLTSENLVELSEWADPHIVLHELSHVWFNQGLFVGRWINEGFAEVYSRRAAVDAGLADETDLWVDQPPVDTAGVGRLNDWVFPDPAEQDPDQIRAYEDYGYAASNWVVQEIAYEIGFDAMAEVIAAADGDLIAYRGALPPEGFEGSDDWRRLLDLVEEVGGSQTATEMFMVYVTDEDLTARTETRSVYRDLIAEGEGWLPPFYVREPMSNWDFDIAVARIGEAQEVLREWAIAEGQLKDLGVAPGDGVKEAYETATASFDGAVSLATSTVVAGETVLEALDAVDRERNLFMQVGLIGVDLDAEYREAIDALRIEDLDAAIAEGLEVISLVEGAERTGQVRLGAAGVGVVLVGGTALILLRRRQQAGPV
jgi:hypothetical protein